MTTIIITCPCGDTLQYTEKRTGCKRPEFCPLCRKSRDKEIKHGEYMRRKARNVAAPRTAKPRAARKPMEPRPCGHPGCTVIFQPNSPNAKYCPIHQDHQGETERRRAGIGKKRIRAKAEPAVEDTTPYHTRIERREAQVKASGARIMACVDPVTHKYNPNRKATETGHA
jgi:hypothetical protein